jgi:CDP-paratose 2-epimerase
MLISTSRVYSIRPLAEAKVDIANQAFHLSSNQTLPSGLTNIGISESFSTTPPVSLYGGTKVASELLALEYGETFNFPVWINRCGVLAGAGQFGRPDQGIFAFWINSWLRRQPLAYIGFGGHGHQVRDCLHPRDLIPLFQKQISNSSTSTRVFNLGGGITHAMSLAALSTWCEMRFGPHSITPNNSPRRFDIPWLIMDSSLAQEVWKWTPQTSLDNILTEIAIHAEQNPNWLELSGCKKA